MSTAPQTVAVVDPYDVAFARRAPALLRGFNDAGVLAAADVHVARRLAHLGGEEDPGVLLAVALAVRAPRLGHVCTDLATIRDTATVDIEAPTEPVVLDWPNPDTWMHAVNASGLVSRGPEAAGGRPLRLVGTRLYLERYWAEQARIAAELHARSDQPAIAVDTALLADGLARLFPGTADDDQRLAGACAVLRRVAVIAGGPGTGKTTTVARILALLDEQAAAVGGPPPRVALAAPTGKAAARLEEAVRAEAGRLDVVAPTRARLEELTASTLHRLLGWRPGSRSRFAHHAGNRLTHDMVVVDETSMVSLSLMAALVQAVRAGARLVFVGDPEQLASVEAGAVLGDLVGPAADGLRMRPAARRALAAVTGQPVPATDAPAGVTVGDGIVVLRHTHRYGPGIATLAEGVRRGDADAVCAVLAAGGEDVRWIEADVEQDAAALAPVRAAVVSAGRHVTARARAGDAEGALAGLDRLRLLCAHRRGPYGVATWSGHVESWLAAEIDGYATEPWYAGRPLLVTANDYGLRLYNGDTGVVVARDAGRVTAVFERRGDRLEVAPARLEAVETVHAMTVHKSQGSQFDAVAVVLPGPDSPILTRELLYTAITRARGRVTVVGVEEAVRAAVGRPIARASGLREALWGVSQPPG